MGTIKLGEKEYYAYLFLLRNYQENNTEPTSQQVSLTDSTPLKTRTGTDTTWFQANRSLA